MIDYDEERREHDEWRLGNYENPSNGCPKCGRNRVCIANNGKHVCEKCGWVIEDNKYSPLTH